MQSPADLIRVARDLFYHAGDEYPLLDDPTIDVSDYIVDLSSQYYDPSVLESVRSELESMLAPDPNDLPILFLDLKLFVESSHVNVPEKESVLAEFRKSCKLHFSQLTRLREVAACIDPRDISWEIVNACVVADWERARALYLRLSLDGNFEISRIQAELGRMLYCQS